MKRLIFISAFILIASWTRAEGTPDYLEVLMNREVTDMTMPHVVDGAAERYLLYDDIKHRVQYDLLSALASRQAGDYSRAFDHIMNAQKLTGNDPDDYTSGMIWMGRYLMSQYINDYQTAVEQALKASECFENIGEGRVDYENYLLEAVRGYVLLGRYDLALTILAGMSDMPEYILAKFYDTQINIYRHTDRLKVPSVLEKMQAEIPANYIYWLNIAYTYSLLGDYSKAIDALDKYRHYNHMFGESAAYHGVRANILEGLGRTGEALDSYKIYASQVEDGYRELIDSDILKKEEQMKAEIERLKYRQVIVVLASSVLMVLLIAYIVLYRLRLRQKAYSEMAARAEEEVERLRLLYENKTLDKELRDALIERLKIFNQFTISKISPNYSERPAEEELRKLIASKDTFLESTCRAFEAVHPEFTAFLAGCNLTERERGCCCLCCMGMRGNEIAAYMGLTDQSYYNFSSNIRRKLGLKEYKTNLDIFLREKMTEFNVSSQHIV